MVQMASPCRLSPFCRPTGFIPVSGDTAPEQSRISQCVAVSAQTLPDVPQMIMLWHFGLVSNKIWSSGTSPHKVCALESHAWGVPFSTDSSQIWFVCESRCQNARIKCPHTRSSPGQHGGVSRDDEHFWCRHICFNNVTLKTERITFSPSQHPNTATLLLTNLRGNRAEKEELL